MKITGKLYDQDFDHSDCYSVTLVLIKGQCTLEAICSKEKYILKGEKQGNRYTLKDAKDSYLTLYETDEDGDVLFGEWKYKGETSFVKVDLDIDLDELSPKEKADWLIDKAAHYEQLRNKLKAEYDEAITESN